MDFVGPYSFAGSSVPPLLASIASVSLGVVAVIRERRSSLSLHFFALTLTIGLWLVGDAWMYASSDEGTALRWARLGHVGVHLIPAAAYSFTVMAVGLYEQRRLLVWAIWLVAGGFAVLSSELITGVNDYWWGYYTRYGWQNLIFLAFFAATLTGAAYEYWRERRQAKPGSPAHQRAGAFLLAYLVGYLGSVDYIPAYGVEFYAFGYLPIFGFLALSARAIWQHHLVEVTPALATDEILETMTEALLVVDQEGMVRILNNAAARLLGAPAEELVGKALPPGLSRSLFVDWFQISSPPGAIGSYEILYPLGSDDDRVFSFSVATVRDDREEPIAVVCLGRDITEQKRAEAEIRALNVQLEQRVAERTAELAASNQELEAFAYSVSHDLRAPLRSIDGFSQILLESHADALDAEGQDCLRRVRAASQRMADLIDDLLRLSRVTRAEMKREQTDVSELARSLAAELQTAEPERRVEWMIADGLEANADPHLLRVALQDLLENAWKFTRNRDQAVIEVGMTRRDGQEEPILFVHDNGAGFDMAYVHKLFIPFERLHLASEFEGTGIGLATVRRIVQRHGGDVWAEGEVEKGATFYFTLGSAAMGPPPVG